MHEHLRDCIPGRGNSRCHQGRGTGQRDGGPHTSLGVLWLVLQADEVPKGPSTDSITAGSSTKRKCGALVQNLRRRAEQDAKCGVQARAPWGSPGHTPERPAPELLSGHGTLTQEASQEVRTITWDRDDSSWGPMEQRRSRGCRAECVLRAGPHHVRVPGRGVSGSLSLLCSVPTPKVFSFEALHQISAPFSEQQGTPTPSSGWHECPSDHVPHSKPSPWAGRWEDVEKSSPGEGSSRQPGPSHPGGPALPKPGTQARARQPGTGGQGGGTSMPLQPQTAKPPGGLYSPTLPWAAGGPQGALFGRAHPTTAAPAPSQPS